MAEFDTLMIESPVYEAKLMQDVPQQFKNQYNISILFGALAKQLDDLATFYRDLLLARTIAVAVGKQLDYIGDIVCLTRAEASAIAASNGIMDDNMYRRYLLYKITLNTSNCTLQDIYDAVRAFGNDIAQYSEDIRHQATIILRMSDKLYEMFSHFKFAKSAGVQLFFDVFPTNNGEDYGLKTIVSYFQSEKYHIDNSQVYEDVLYLDEDVYRLESVDSPSYNQDFLEFSSSSSFTLEYLNHVKGWEGELFWKANEEDEWEEWDAATILQSGNDNRLFLQGMGNTKISRVAYGSTVGQFVLSGDGVSVNGPLASLLDHEKAKQGIKVDCSYSAFQGIFRNNICLIKAPSLNGIRLSGGCFEEAFSGCTGLVMAPDLPETTLADSCYSGMFRGCSSLTKAPELPATILQAFCYMSMFRDCTSLLVPPELPATTLEDCCYEYMFMGCTALLTPPELPATVMKPWCYDGMFWDCTFLSTSPRLPATILAEGCYEYMFCGCFDVQVVVPLPALPKLPATYLPYRCYHRMFTGLNIKLSTEESAEYPNSYRIPDSGEGTAESEALLDMFGNTLPFRGTPSLNTTYYTSNPVV